VILFTLLLFLLFFLLYFFVKDFRNLGIIYISSWIFMMFLLLFGIVKYVEINLYFWLYLSIVSIAICVFSYTGSRIANVRQQSLHVLNMSKFGTYFYTFLGYFSLFFSLKYYNDTFGLQNLIYDPSYVRANDTGGSGLQGFILFSLPISFIIIANSLKNGSKILKLFQGFFLFCAFVFFCILPERTTLIVTLVWFIGTRFVNYKITPKLMRKYVVYVVALVGFFVSFFILVSQRTQKVDSAENVRPYLNPLYSSLSNAIIDPYIYLTGNLPALSYAIENLGSEENKEFGEKTLLPLYRIVEIITNSPEKSTNNATFSEIPFPFNTYSWLYDPIYDYGVIGSVVYVSIVFLLIGFYSKKAIHEKGFRSKFLYGLLFSAVILSTMTNKFSGILYWYAFFHYFLLSFFERRKQIPNENSIESEQRHEYTHPF
jgi:oligosaccharide repeat unit polymerase